MILGNFVSDIGYFYYTLHKNLLPIETAAQCAKMTLDEFKVAMDKNEN